MPVWKNRLVPIVFALAGALFLVPVVKEVVTGEPVDGALVVLAIACLVFAYLAFSGRRSSGGGAGPA
jgi:hypothetical protein